MIDVGCNSMLLLFADVVAKEQVAESGRGGGAIIYYCFLCFIQFSHVFYTTFRLLFFFFLFSYRFISNERMCCLACEPAIIFGSTISYTACVCIEPKSKLSIQQWLCHLALPFCIMG